jgi:inorganic pyrophosphatase
MPRTPLGHVNNLSQLQREYPQALEIIQRWFTNYKGPGEMQLRGTSDKTRADEMLKEAIRQYQQHHNRQR